MAKDKKTFQEMNNGEKFRYYKRRRNASIVGRWACIVSPFGIVFGVKFNEYIKIMDTGDTIKLSIGCILALVVAAIAIYKQFKHSDETKHIAPAIGWGVALAFAWLFEIILHDLVLILASEFAGQCAAVGVDYYCKHATEEMNAYKTLAREDNTLHYKEPKKVKVKVVK